MNIYLYFTLNIWNSLIYFKFGNKFFKFIRRKKVLIFGASNIKGSRNKLTLDIFVYLFTFFLFSYIVSTLKYFKYDEKWISSPTAVMSVNFLSNSNNSNKQKTVIPGSAMFTPVHCYKDRNEQQVSLTEL